MTIPRGAMWQRLRQQALSSVSPEARVAFRAPTSLGNWQAQGSYSISSTSSSRFSLVVQSEDFGGALFSDASFHLDHALEHQASLMNALQGGGWFSPAWQVVTFYYWSYFCAMAVSRMLGQTVWFVTPDVARQFSRMSAAASATPGQGTFEVRCEEVVSAGFRAVRLIKKGRRLHEQLWATTFRALKSMFDEFPTGTMLPDEERLYRAIFATVEILGDDWPSALRNLVNYRPGFAYTAPRFIASLETLAYVDAPGQTIGSIVDRLENSTITMRNDPQVATQPRIAVRMLVDLTLLLNRIAHGLQDEIIERTKIDRRWRNNQRRFSEQQGVFRDGVPWPC